MWHSLVFVSGATSHSAIYCIIDYSLGPKNDRTALLQTQALEFPTSAPLPSRLGIVLGKGNPADHLLLVRLYGKGMMSYIGLLDIFVLDRRMLVAVAMSA